MIKKRIAGFIMASLMLVSSAASSLNVFVIETVSADAVSSSERMLPSGNLSFDEIKEVTEEFYEKNAKNQRATSLAVITPEETVYEGYFGFEDNAKTNPVNEDTVIEWGSVTKLVTWVSVMQLAEQGKIDLNEDIRTYLPDNFFKKLKYDDKITMINLMNHNAGFEECSIFSQTYDNTKLDTLEHYMKTVQPAQVFRPGEVTAYSNWGAALAGYIVQLVSGKEFWEYANDYIFTPLEMTHTSLKPDYSDNEFVRSQREKLECYDILGRPAGAKREYINMYPAGSCASTLTDITAFCRALLTKDDRLMKEETYNQMFEPSSCYTGTEVPRNSHGLWWTIAGEDTAVIGHAGNSDGCSSSLCIDINNNIGFVVMSAQSAESSFNGQYPNKIFGDCAPEKYSEYTLRNTEYNGILSISRNVFRGPFKLLSIRYTFMPMLKAQQPDAFVVETENAVEIQAIDYMKTSTAEYIMKACLYLGWIAFTVLALVILIVKFIKMLAKKESINSAAHWRTFSCFLQLLPFTVQLVLCFMLQTMQVPSVIRIASIVALVSIIALAAVTVYGIKIFISDADVRMTKFRNLLTLLASVFIIFAGMYCETGFFWLV